MNQHVGAETLRPLLEAYRAADRKLNSIYRRLPEVTCRGKAACCTLLPDLTLAEALSAFQSLVNMEETQRRDVIERTALYFYLNPVKTMSCPFLENKRCIIYERRFSGCRTYGLWSRRHYERMAARSLEAKRNLQSVWQQAGVQLPPDVTGFHVPYCTHVRVVKGKRPDDSALVQIGTRVANLSEQISQAMHVRFVRDFYMDFSFFMVSLASGMQGAANDKFVAVRSVCAGQGTGIAEKGARKVADYLQEFFSRL